VCRCAHFFLTSVGAGVGRATTAVAVVFLGVEVGSAVGGAELVVFFLSAGVGSVGVGSIVVDSAGVGIEVGAPVPNIE
jgi:hypothetical protein